MKTLESLRKKIDDLDAKIVELLNARADLSLAIAEHKRSAGLPIFAPERESQLLKKILRQGRDRRLPPAALTAIYREIISASIALQGTLKIAFFGPAATNTHQAARDQFGALAEYIPVSTIADVFAEVERGRVNYGVVPIENSTEGVVAHTLDMFAAHEVQICSELELSISHQLLSKASSRAGIKTIYSHPHAFPQCRNWLKGNLPEATLVEVSSTARAAQMAARSARTAAIASRLAGKLYGLNTLAERIEDDPSNTTRFLVLGRHAAKPTGYDKTSVMIAIKDKVGALYELLRPFSKYNINLLNIESRPSRLKNWNYIFYVDFLGHAEDAQVQRVLQAIKRQALSIKILGSFPRSARS
jgi:chorismate mutase/prephenate dehydratase